MKGFIATSLLDWPGKVSAVVFLPGCNLRCPFCHNHPLVLRPDTLPDIPLDTVLASIRKHRGWVDGVVITGGEPTVYPGLEAVISAIRETGLPVRLDTNGTRPDVLNSLIAKGLIEAVAMDIKAPLKATAYGRAAGVNVDVAKILESIGILTGSGLDVSFRATVVPGLHDEAAVSRMARAVAGRLTLQNFRPDDALDPDFRRILPFTPDEFRRLLDAAGKTARGR